MGKKSTRKIAFPSNVEGLNGELSQHFGHALAFTLITYIPEKKKIHEIEVIRNVAHQHGGCMRPIRLLMNSNVSEIVVGGIGKRPCQGFKQVGIKVYKGIKDTVKNNFKAFINDKLTQFDINSTCPGSVGKSDNNPKI
jgi:predicted Fe-Mo cluster-binding NifX family protein